MLVPETTRQIRLVSSSTRSIIPSCSETFVVPLSVLIRGVLLEGRPLHGRLEVLSAGFADDGLGLLVLIPRRQQRSSGARGRDIAHTDASCDVGPFLMSLAFFSRFDAALAPLPIFGGWLD